MDSKAVVSQNLCQSHAAGKIFPMVPKPPSCETPALVAMY